MSEVPRPGWALVIGGSGGIGTAISRRLAQDRDVVVTWGQRQEPAEQLARDIGGSARQVILPGGDLGPLDGLGLLVFAAGVDIGQPYLSKTTPDELRTVLQVEVEGFFGAATQALPALRESGGAMVAVSSAGLGRFPPGDGLSVTPKAAVQALIHGFAREEGRHGVRANAVAVGVVEAGIFHRIQWDAQWLETARKNIPLRRFGHASDVAEAVAFLGSEQAGYITGQTLYVDGGYSV